LISGNDLIQNLNNHNKVHPSKSNDRVTKQKIV